MLWALRVTGEGATHQIDAPHHIIVAQHAAVFANEFEGDRFTYAAFLFGPDADHTLEHLAGVLRCIDRLGDLAEVEAAKLGPRGGGGEQRRGKNEG